MSAPSGTRRTGAATSEAAAQPLRQLPAALRRAELQIARVRRQHLRRRGIGARDAQSAERDGRSARCDLLLCHHTARDGGSRRLAQWPAHPPGRSPVRQSAHTRKTPVERPPASRRTVPTSARRYAGSTPPAGRRRGGCLRQGTARRPNASPGAPQRSPAPRHSTKPNMVAPLSPIPRPKKDSPYSMGESFVSMPVNSVPRLNVVRQVLERIDELTVLCDLKMQMRTAADAARAGHAMACPCLTTAPTLTERLERCW